MTQINVEKVSKQNTLCIKDKTLVKINKTTYISRGSETCVMSQYTIIHNIIYTISDRLFVIFV